MHGALPVRIVYRGMGFNGWYEVADGQVKVSSAYGSGSAPVQKKAAPEAVARGVLQKLVEGWKA